MEGDRVLICMCADPLVPSLVELRRCIVARGIDLRLLLETVLLYQSEDVVMLRRQRYVTWQVASFSNPESPVKYLCSPLFVPFLHPHLLVLCHLMPKSTSHAMPGGFQDDRILALGAAASEKGARPSRIVDAIVPRQRHACLDRSLAGQRYRQSLRACQGVNVITFW